MYTSLTSSSAGNLQIVVSNGYVLQITLIEEKFKSFDLIEIENSLASKEEKELCETVFIQVEEYLLGKRKKFDFKLKYDTTSFGKEVYETLRGTNYGEVYSYKDIANLVKRPRAVRSIGSFMRKNEFAFIVPCHRVIKSDGTLGNYFGNINLKEQLIELEKENK